MAPVFETLSSTTYAGRADTSVTAPSGITTGDLILLALLLGRNPAPDTPTAPSGFVRIPGAWPTTVADASSFTVHMDVYYKIAGGSEPGSYAFTHTSMSSQLVAMRISGVDTADPFEPNPSLNEGTGSTTTFTGVTTTAADTLIVSVSHDYADATTGLSPPSGSTPTFTERFDTGGLVSPMYVASGLLASPGATGDKTQTNNSSGPNPWAASLIPIIGVAVTGPYVGAGAAATAASGNVTPALPGSLATDDALILEITARDNVSCSVATSGGSGNAWTQKTAHNNGSGLRQEIWWKRRGSGDADTHAAVTHTAGDKIIARVHAIRVPGTGDPFEATGGPTSVAAATTGAFPNVTTLTDDAFLFYAFSYAEDFTTGPSISSAEGLTLTERDETEVT